jgi:predicted amidophosphoribosyltransferase
MIWRPLANYLLSSLFEPPCAACAAALSHPLDGAVCAACWQAIASLPGAAPPPIGGRFEAAAPDHAIDAITAVGPYEGRLRDVIHALKYDGRRSVARPLGALMRGSGTALLAGAAAVIPVPLHPRKQHSRGFNQADDLARQLGPPVVPLLCRRVFTRPQIELPAEARQQNVKGAFVLAPGARNARADHFWPRRAPCAGTPLPAVVVIVDDVCTTGATLEACARVLKAAGVREVRALTAARVASGRP